jgi:endo-1,4-beta-xylanase
MKLRLGSIPAVGLAFLSWACANAASPTGDDDGIGLGTGGASAAGGTFGTGGSPGTGGTTNVGTGGGVTAGGGGTTPGSGGTTAGSGGTSSSAGGHPGTGGASSGGKAGSAGASGTGGTSLGSGGAAGRGGRSGGSGGTGTGGLAGSGGMSGRTGGSGTGGSAGTGVGSAGAPTVDCSTPMPTGGTTHTGSNVNGTVNGLNYGIWTNGSGGSITVFSDAPAFSTSWNNSQDFLAHLGLDFRTAKAYTAYGTITALFSEKKTGSGGGFSTIGIYGWTHSPCVEWYITEDSFNGLGGGGGTTVTIDGGTYTLSNTMTTGTGGANACESGHTGSWAQIRSNRKTARTCGVVTVSDHFAAWEKQGWSLGTLSMVHINIEVGGGNGSIDFPVANVTTTSN